MRRETFFYFSFFFCKSQVLKDLFNRRELDVQSAVICYLGWGMFKKKTATHTDIYLEMEIVFVKSVNIILDIIVHVMRKNTKG